MRTTQNQLRIFKFNESKTRKMCVCDGVDAMLGALLEAQSGLFI